MSDDRNEGECYGPFHAGFICEDCADRYRALEAALERAIAINDEAIAFAEGLKIILQRAAGYESGRPKG